MREFTYEALPMRVAFGPGRAASVGDELEHLGLRRVLVLCTPGQQKTARVVADGLGDRCAAVYPEARMHVPAEVADAACAVAAAAGCRRLRRRRRRLDGRASARRSLCGTACR